MGATRINFTSIPVVDQDRAIGFYTRHLGFSVQVDVPYAEDWRWVFLTLPEAGTKLTFSRASELQVTGVPALCLVCDSVDAEADRLRAAGVAITDGPSDAPWAAPVRYLMIRDSENNLVLLESLKEG
ncbi:MAG: VOC family protein [Paracoccaceae bacterium]